MPKTEVIWSARCPRGHPPDWHLKSWAQQVRTSLDRDPSGWAASLLLVATVVEHRALTDLAELGARAQVKALTPSGRVCLGNLATAGTSYTHQDASEVIYGYSAAFTIQPAVIVLTWRGDLVSAGPRVDAIGHMLDQATEDDLMSMACGAADSWDRLGGNANTLRGLAGRAMWTEAKPTVP